MKNNLADTTVLSEELLTDAEELRREVDHAVMRVQVIDVHTHVFPPEFGAMCLSGIDDLLTYHYLIAEMFRSATVSYASFWKMNKAERADLVWQTLFVDNTPLSEATRGIVSILEEFGLDSRAPNLDGIRSFFRSRDPKDHLDWVLRTAQVSDVVMTNDPLNEHEAWIWKTGVPLDARFHATLRLDNLVNEWDEAARKLAGQGLSVNATLSGSTTREVRRFLDQSIERMRPLYLAVSLPPEFDFPKDDVRTRLLREIVLPTAREHQMAVALMIGVRRGVNPALRSAGDGMGRAEVAALERLCAENHDVRFLATFLARENQHELCVAARKFNNLMPFGCWWFLNNPSIVAEITRERLELLGPGFIPQHSDARVLEQLIYKWRHSRAVIADCLSETYSRLLSSGRAVTRCEIERDVERLFSGNFERCVGMRLRDK
ncbi:MAG TPA: hypothetical protein VHP99_13360 [Pyrinomonadaceae bacterium]|nr:hypothetical protein [Pyrinomonadaceae bacterium]